MQFSKTLFFVFLVFFLFSFNNQAQTTFTNHQNSSSKEERLVREKSVYLLASSSLDFGKSTTLDGSRETTLDFNASGFYSLSKYFAVGGFASVHFNRNSVVSNANLWQFSFGPQAGFFLPNKLPITPYLSGSLGPSRIINKIDDQSSEDGFFLRGG